MSDLLGRTYQPGEDIVTEGEVGDCMYVIQQGSAEVIRTEDGVATVVDTMDTAWTVSPTPPTVT